MFLLLNTERESLMHLKGFYHFLPFWALGEPCYEQSTTNTRRPLDAYSRRSRLLASRPSVPSPERPPTFGHAPRARRGTGGAQRPLMRPKHFAVADVGKGCCENEEGTHCV